MRAETAKVRLREVVAQPDTILFVGAGVSAWSGLPTWSGLIAELADFLESHGFSPHLVRRELEQGDLLQAASFGFDLLTPQDRVSFLRQACRYGTAQPSPLHRRLATLGPRAFVTTNFDKLLEQALSVERPNLSFQMVNNVNLVETGSIIQSRARDFVFKPHGDIDMSDSVVLTREQYRDLQHKKQYAFEAFKTLMASRPVVFVGFGLRDPDFLLIKDTLAAIYMGAAQDHYAITADVDEQEAVYWRNNYGIHLISYDKVEANDTTERHSALLELLDEVAATETASHEPERPSPDSATLAILRHARRMVQLGPAPDVEILPLAASPYPRQGSVVPAWETRLPFIEGDAVSGLQQNRSRLLLTGAPGAGKTFVVQAAVAHLAKAVIDEALEGDREAPIPAYIDLRDYSGDLWKMVIESFPLGFPVHDLVAEGNLAFFVDGLNEVSAQVIEDNTLTDDLWSFLDRTRACSVVLVTRFGEEHTELRLPEIALEEIPRSYVVGKLEEKGVAATSISEEFLSLLERPVFYRFCLQHELWDKRTPHAIYTAVISRLNDRARERFGDLDLMELFGRVAFESIDTGDLQIPVIKLLEHLEKTGFASADSEAVINWLLGEGMLIPRRNQHVNFFHHSVTEHMAAYDLVSQYRTDPRALSQMLEGHRWDQVVLLSIGFLSEQEQQEFFNKVMETDTELALRGLAYIDTDWEKWTAAALRHLAELEQLSWEDRFSIPEALKSTRVSNKHEQLLLKLAERQDILGGEALAKTVQLRGRPRIDRAINDLFECADDFNRCSAVGRSLAGGIDDVQARHLLARLGEHQLDQETLDELEEGGETQAVRGLIVGSREAISQIALEVLRDALEPLASLQPLLQEVLADRLLDDASPEAVELMADLMEVNPRRASVGLHLQIAHLPKPPDISCLHPEKHGPMLLAAEDLRKDGWAIDTLRILGSYSSDWLDWINGRAEEEPSGLVGALLWHAAQRSDCFFSKLEELRNSKPDWSAEPLRALSMAGDVDWRGHEELFLSLLRQRHDDLAVNLLNGLRFGFEPDFSHSIESEEVGWWIDWLSESREDSYWLKDRLGRFVATAATWPAIDTLVEIFTDGTEQERSLLAYFLLGHVKGLQLSALPEEAIAWALRDLGTTPVEEPEIEESVLASVATERFVEDVLLPQLEEADEPLRSNLLAVIRKAGERHRRRYVTTSGQPLI